MNNEVYMINLTIIWHLSNDLQKTCRTRDSLEKLYCKDNVMLVTISDHKHNAVPCVSGYQQSTHIEKEDAALAQLLNLCKQHFVRQSYVLFMQDGDTISANASDAILTDASAFSPSNLPGIIMPRRETAEELSCNFFSFDHFSAAAVLDLDNDYSCLPAFLNGIFVHGSYFADHTFAENLPYDFEKDFLLRLCCRVRKIYVNPAVTYLCATPLEGDPTFFAGVYDRAWYYESIQDFWCPFFMQIQEEYHEIPEFLQYYAMFFLDARFKANLNNTNKHVISAQEAYSYMRHFQDVFSFISDEVILNARKVRWWEGDLSLQLLYLKLKYGEEQLSFQTYYLGTDAYLGYGNVIHGKLTDQNVNIKYMEYDNELLKIEGSISPYLDFATGTLVAEANGQQIVPHYDSIYSHTKCFGITYSKRKTFRIEVPVPCDGKKLRISFFYRENHRKWKLTLTYDSHFSRLTKRFRNSHWIFCSPIQHYIVRSKNNSITVSPIPFWKIFLEEGALLKEMFLSRNKAAMKYAFYRIGYFFMRLFYRKKKIWFYMDKIYKAGDSSEYLYKYAVQQKERNVKHYYLVDKSCPDYKRLRKEGYHPLIRGSTRHRLLFLLADWVIASNSTVYAFNDYTLEASAYIRDLPHFKTACVQHGMSVQKIAVAQNRLRDNIGLYFCASKYEIENLSHPIYGYVGTNILKLTGVPRYDGLISNDKKQILISPTWRMQAAVPVSKNEGVARDYNPLFKDTAYYKVYNELINDVRFIDSAKKYGYRILFVLHPIVSPQIDDFDKNDYVELIPSTGEMSYEKIFCESSLMVTDFSGVQYDFAYMKKPVVYLHHRDIPKHYEEGVFRYDSMAFGEICIDNNSLIDTIIEYMQNGCQMKEQYRQRADDFFYYNDHHNCERIYREMLSANAISCNNNNVR